MREPPAAERQTILRLEFNIFKLDTDLKR